MQYMHTTKKIRVLGEMKLVFEFHHTPKSFTVSPIQETSFTCVSYRCNCLISGLKTCIALFGVLRPMRAQKKQKERKLRWPIVATGNWGCGAFGGYVPVKAVVA